MARNRRTDRMKPFLDAIKKAEELEKMERASKFMVAKPDETCNTPSSLNQLFSSHYGDPL